ncbi:hypothetical protein ATANTOWER_019027 [Ataeniobius toweri]|uniref:Reverse transcriptase n=1 Tax=Ataeniobius toweri TaxID=208326 RepID=A0ABU7CF73_9TELE|nr:hypothetical protein [Ataeniobius toweri]
MKSGYFSRGVSDCPSGDFPETFSSVICFEVCIQGGYLCLLCVYIEDLILLKDDFSWDRRSDGLQLSFRAVSVLEGRAGCVNSNVDALAESFRLHSEDVLCLYLLVCFCWPYHGDFNSINVRKRPHT